MKILSRKHIRKLNKNNQTLKFMLFITLILFGFVAGVNINKIESITSSGSTQKLSAAENISPKDLKDKLTNKDFYLVNVHTPYDGEIEKTDAFIDYDSIVANEDKLPKDKSTPIIVYCRSGNMSSQAVKTLESLGYRNVRQLTGGMEAWKKAGYSLLDLASLPSEVLPDAGFELPISWGNMGPELVEAGVIDKNKFESTVKPSDEQKQILENSTTKKITINSKNSQFIVDMLWAFGLAQKSDVYETGPMSAKDSDIENYASTGGWTLGKGNAVLYLGKYDFLKLSTDQQVKVSEIAKNVYRPCCGNSAYFPDCNHGMAALGAIELMVAQGLSDNEIYANVLKLNSFWFPTTYLTDATYFARQGVTWNNVDAKTVLGQAYSSGQGAAAITQKVGPLPFGGNAGGSCGA